MEPGAENTTEDRTHQHSKGGNGSLAVARAEFPKLPRIAAQTQ